MKSNVLILKAVLLLLGGNLVACDDSKEPEVVGTPPVAASEEVTAFFTTHLPESSYNCSEVKFNFSEIDFGETECFLINSTEEFEAVAPPSVVLPDRMAFELNLPVIDFEKYTLIIGQHLLGDPGYSFEKQAVDTDTESGKMTLNLVYSRMGGASPTVITTFYVWGLYSKLPGSAIDVKITII